MSEFNPMHNMPTKIVQHADNKIVQHADNKIVQHAGDGVKHDSLHVLEMEKRQAPSLKFSDTEDDLGTGEIVYPSGEVSHEDPTVKFIKNIIMETVPVTVFLINGIKLQGNIEMHDKDAILLTGIPGQHHHRRQLVYKHAISTIVPTRDVDV